VAPHPPKRGARATGCQPALHEAHTIVIVVALALAACGSSKEEKASKQACDARSDISKQIDQLKGRTVSTATTDGITKSLGAIRSDLSDIKDAQPGLSDQRRQEFKAANQAFAAEVESVATSIGKSLAPSEGKDQLTGTLASRHGRAGRRGVHAIGVMRRPRAGPSVTPGSPARPATAIRSKEATNEHG
jgi:hypothetical protein